MLSVCYLNADWLTPIVEQDGRIESDFGTNLEFQFSVCFHKRAFTALFAQLSLVNHLVYDFDCYSIRITLISMFSKFRMVMCLIFTLNEVCMIFFVSK